MGYRLAKHGLEVVFCRDAVQYMNRPLSYDEFCRRCVRQGKGLVQFANLYPTDSRVQDYCQIVGAQQCWREMRGELDRKVARVRELEAMPTSNGNRCPGPDELHELYRWTFHANKLERHGRSARMGLVGGGANYCDLFRGL